MSDRIRQQHQTSPEHAGVRFDQAAAELFPAFSRARLQHWIKSGALTVDGRSQRPAFRLAGGETLALDAEPESEVDVVAQPLDLSIVHSDDSLLVLDKAAGMVVHPAAGNPDGTLQNALLHLDPALAQVPRAGIVHRLDKDTSGVMVVARTLQAHTALVRQLQERSMSRIYHAVTQGCMLPAGTVDAPIGRHPRQRQKMAVVSGGKPAVSHYRRLRGYGHFSHVEVSLESGRTHQIRVHMRHLGFPIVGDSVYGRRLKKNAPMPDDLRTVIESFPRQALHARFLSLEHPEHRQTMKFEAMLPDDMADLLSALDRFDSR